MLHLYPVVLKGLEQEFRAVKFLKAVKAVEAVVNSEEFKEWFIAHPFTQLGENKFKTREALLDQLLQTVEFVYAVKPRPWYKRYSSVIGYTIGNEITTYRNAYDNMSLPEFCGHLAHELTHCPTINFSHSVNYTKERDNSLPYAIGNYVERAVTAKIKA